MAKKARRKVTSKWQKAGMLTVRLGMLFVILSIIWTGLYAFMPVRETALMGWRKAHGAEIKADWVQINDISPQLVRAVIAAEDNKFCRHFGFDLGEIKSAIDDARKGGRLRGASTITQQTAKNAFLWPGRDVVRKGLEVWFTALSEALWSKRRVMEVYLNIAEWGDGTFGAEAAAQKLFNKSARDLTAYEASLMAAVLPSPNKWSAAPPGPYVTSRAATIRARMASVRNENRDSCVLGVRKTNLAATTP